MSGHRGPSLVLLTLFNLVGCGDDVGPVDSAVDAASDSGGALVVTAPDIPWLVDGAPRLAFTPCPDGWREVHGALVTECDPYPEGGAASCPDGDAHFPGEPGCRPIGDACPPGDYATSIPSAGSVVYVKEGAPAGGDGTESAPFAALSAVPWASLRGSTTVALAKGTYAGTLPLRAGVAVVGACVEETIVMGVAGPVQSVVSVANAGDAAAVENLTIRGAPQRGATVSRGRSLSLRGVLIDGAREYGIFASDAATEVSLDDVVVRGTVPLDPLSTIFGVGIDVQSGARLEATKLLVEGSQGLGVAARETGTEVFLSRAVVRDTQPQPSSARGGRGVYAENGARLELTAALVASNHTVGLSAWSAGTLLIATHTIVRDTKSRADDGFGGAGIVVEGGAGFTATRLLVASNHDIGVSVGDGGTAELTDVIVRDTVAEASGANTSRAISVGARARLTVLGLVATGNTEIGAYVGATSTLRLTDALIASTSSDPGAGNLGRGVTVQGGGRVEASRLLIAGNRELGLVAVGEGSFVDLSDVVIRDTLYRAGDHRFGRGLQAEAGARLEGRRVEIDRSFEGGAAALTGATVVLDDVSIQDVAVADCAATTCPMATFGFGAGAFSGSLSMTRFRVSDAEVCGVMVAPVEGHGGLASLDLRDGHVSSSAIGACVQVEGYDVGRLTAGVHYEDNRTNLDSTSLPVPGVSDPIAP